jgi:hypothetical protein
VRGLSRADEHLDSARPGNLHRDAGRRAEAVDPEPTSGTDRTEPQGPVADDACAEERRRLGIVERPGQRVRKGFGNGRIVGEAAVGLPAGEARALAEVLAALATERAHPARAPQPRDAHAIAGAKARAVAHDAADHLVPGNDRRNHER